jgi:hypothetical protein
MTMGMHDELFCEAELPDSDVLAGATFETKAFPYPFLYRYKITKAGRLIDACGRDLECDGYLEFYHCDFDRSVDRIEYRAHFCRGQLENIVRVNEEPEGAADRVIYGLAAYRLFTLAAPSNFMSDMGEDDIKNLGELVGNLKRSAADASVPRPAEEQEWMDTPAAGRELL